MTRFSNNLHQVRSTQNNLKVFGSKKTKGSKQNSQNLLRSPMSEGGEQENQKPKKGTQNLLRTPMSEGGEQENQRA